MNIRLFGRAQGISLLMILAMVVQISFPYTWAWADETSPTENSQIAVTAIKLNKDYLRISKNATERLQATIEPANATSPTLVWTSNDERIVTVSNSGLVIPGAVGRTAVTVRVEGSNLTADCLIDVYDPAPVNSVNGVTLNKATTTISVGNTETLAATISPSNAGNKNVSWQSDTPSIAEVDQSGRVTAKAAGSARITVNTQDGNFSAACNVTVVEVPAPVNVPIKSIELSPSSVTVGIGSKVNVVAIVSPANASNKNIIWKSDDDSVATVQNGVVTGVSAGLINIWADSAENSRVYKRCRVEVLPAVNRITIDTSASLTVGAVKQLTATTYPSEAARPIITWTSKSPGVATVDATGKVRAVSVGTALITATTDNGNIANCNVSVSPAVILPTSLTLYPSNLSLQTGQNVSLTATLYPNNVTNRNISWSSDNTSVATVTGNSTAASVRGVSVGSATITATSSDGTKQATCYVTVTNIGTVPTSIQSISITAPTNTLTPGGTIRLIPTVTPIGAVGTFTWTSSRPTVATVDTYGYVRGVTAGSTVITVRDQSGNQDTCTVTVTASAVPVTVPTVPGNVSGNSVTLPFTPVSTFENGKTVITALVDESSAMIAISQRSGLTSAILPVTSGNATVKTQVYYGVLSSLMSKNAIIEVRSDYGSYLLPAKAVNISSVAGQLGAPYSAVKYNITVDKLDQDQTNVIKSTAAEEGLSMITTPVTFSLEGSYGSKTAEITQFNGYVEQGIVLSSYVDANTAGGVRVNDDGTFTPVPTRFATANGKTVAYIKSLTNGTYSVVQVQKSFVDTANHWAKNDINILASKMVVSGVRPNQYAPEKKVTRAEFAAIVVRALGLEPTTEQVNFSDVALDDWYAGVVGAAVKAGIIKGYQDNSFKPNAYVTREEVAVMLVRAMKLAGVDTTIGVGGNQQYLVRFNDEDQINSWAEESIAVAVKLEVINGNSKGMFLPSNNTTRAETAVTIKRMLTKAQFI